MIEAIGGNISLESQNLENSSIGQEDFIKLFLAQLTNQDPMEPVDNSQFLAQMAQFTSLEQSRLLNDNMTNLLAMNSSNQGVNLLGKNVSVRNGVGSFEGTVDGVHFNPQGVSLTIKGSDGQFLSDVSLTDISLIRE
ncbi:flagellar hook assembly protein FlgD [Flocculibacter collagenilyticus]|uniref:flagellar hook assembly protein FlgD n=1 Tax=Flocculibacter collagenilyticus TaxID=2744479 RepID=UPI0018F5E734|nr:flagellar hook capping FlgD N-terminal domain-containing protein [Flocculibacter collagenilyticus]